MNANILVIVNDLWSLAGWTMVHFLWLGAIVAAIAFAGRSVLRNAAPNVRYSFSLMCLALITAMPLVATRFSRDSFLAPVLASAARPNLPPSTNATANSPPLKGGAGGGIPSDANAPTTAASPTSPIIELHTSLSPAPPPPPPPSPAAPDANPSPLHTPPSTLSSTAPQSSLLTTLILYLPWLWLIGTPLTFALLFTGLIGTRRLSRASTPINDGPIADALGRLTTSLRITRRVTVAVCERVAAPVLIGILRPMILLPPAALTGWSPGEIEMVLLHELAHIRRYDNVVNLAQRIIESLLFFHPAVWLISTWVRREREACCDAAVVARTQQPHAYATLLVNLAAQVLPSPTRRRPHIEPSPSGRGKGEGAPAITSPILSPASAMAAGPLRTRIRHILQLEDDPMLVTPKSLAITLATLLAAATLAFVYLPKIGQAEQSATEATENTEKKADSTNAPAKPLNSPMLVSAPNAGEVSEQAWRQLGIRISVASGAEQTSRFGRALKIVSGIAIPKDLEGPVFLLGINDIETNDFDDVARALKKAKDQRITVVKCVVHTKQGRVWIDTSLDGSDKPEQRIRKTPIVPPAPATQPTFTADKLDVETPARRVSIGNENCNLNDIPDVAPAFVISDSNPEETRKYAVERPLISAVLDAMKATPHGRYLTFTYATDNSGKSVTITAPKDAHNKFLKGVIDRFNQGMISAPPLGKFPTVENQIPTNDDWPKGIAFPSPKEGEISKRAWQLFHVKIVPASDEELKQVLRRGKRGGLKLVDFDEFPHFEEPFILTDIGSKPISRGIVTFDDLATVLDTLESQPAGSDDIIGLNGEAKNGHFQYNLRLPSSSNVRTSTKFPSLEDQKLADLAWKRLGLELEPIAGDDLQRVKALGYDGGVKVVVGQPEGGGFGGGTGGSHGRIQADDILVGLHVWPTTNLKDIATILNRDDLAEFDPLKFYVIRKLTEQSSTSPPQTRDTVVTGRINVQLAPTVDRSNSRSNPYGPTQEPNRKFASIPFDPYALPSQSAPAPQGIESDLRRGLTCIAFFSQPAEKDRESLAAAANKVQRQTPNPWRFVIYDVNASPKAMESFAADRFPTYIFWRDGVEVCRLSGPQSVEQLTTTFYTVEFSRPNSGATFPPSVSSPPPLAPRSSHLNSSLRYDGKPFEEWRNVWKTELSTEKRIEAVKALAAFGRAGYGPDAAAAILDVAGEYDFMIISNNDLESQLKQAVLDELAPGDRTQTLAPYWIPDLAARLQKVPKKWKWLAYHLIMRLQSNDESTLKTVRELESSGDNVIRSAALGVLVRAGRTGPDGSQLDEKTRKLIDKYLDNKDPEMVRAALSYLTYSPPPGGTMAHEPRSLYQPTALPKLLFHADDDVRRRTRSLLPLLDDKATTDLVDPLIAILKDPLRQRDQIEAIRAISALGKKAAKATDVLTDILKSSNDQDTLVSAVAATIYVTAGEAPMKAIHSYNFPDNLAKTFFQGVLNESERNAFIKKIGGPDGKDYSAFHRRLMSEEGIISQRPETLGGGGGFF